MARDGRIESFHLRADAGAGALHLRARLLRPPGQQGLRRSRWRSRACRWARAWRARRRRPADIVVPVPDSGLFAAMGYSRESGLPLEFGLTRNHYVGRTFIEPKQSIRNFGVKIKLNPVRELIEGKRVVLVDDSIVRGTTSRKIVRMMREARSGRGPPAHLGAADRSGPATTGSTRRPASELIAAHHSDRGDPPVHRGGQPRLPLARRHARLRRRPAGQLLHRLLDRRLPRPQRRPPPGRALPDPGGVVL